MSKSRFESSLSGRLGTGATLAAFGFFAAGCSTPSLPSMPSMPSLFSSSGSGSGEPSAAGQLPPNFECPSVTVRSGAATLVSSADPADSSPTNLRYQVNIGTTARECRVANNMLSIKVGVQGRVILGPQGSPGQVDVPIRYAVVFETVPPKTILTKLERVSVTVPPDDPNVPFTNVVESLEFPMPRAAEIDSYVIYVGFDPMGAQEMDRRKQPPKPVRPRRQVSESQSGTMR